MQKYNFLARLKNVKEVGPNKYIACCPAHDDKHPSLSVGFTDKKILLNCHKGCLPEQVVSSIGLTMADLFIDDEGSRLESRPGGRDHNRQEVAVYPYTDENGTVLAEKVRFKPKGFMWRTQKADGKYDYHKPDFVPPYNMTVLRNSPFIFLVEGEKDVDTLTGLNVPATSLPDGSMSGKWPRKYTQYFSGKAVIIIPDNDEVGKAYSTSASKAIYSVATIVGALDLKNGGRKSRNTGILRTISPPMVILQRIKSKHWQS